MENLLKEEQRLQRLRMVVKELNANKAKKKHQRSKQSWTKKEKTRESHVSQCTKQQPRTVPESEGETVFLPDDDDDAEEGDAEEEMHFGHFSLQELGFHAITCKPGELDDVNAGSDGSMDGKASQNDSGAGSSRAGGRSTEKSHRCVQCTYSTNIKTNLITHMRTHSGEKPFTCDFCDKAFSQKSHLKRHSVKLHSGQYMAARRSSMLAAAGGRRGVTDGDGCSGGSGGGGTSGSGSGVPGKNLLPCNLCHANFSTINKLIQHMEQHPNSRYHFGRIINGCSV